MISHHMHELSMLPAQINYRGRAFPCKVKSIDKLGVALELNRLSLPDGLNLDIEFFVDNVHIQFHGQIKHSNHEETRFQFCTAG